MKVPGAGALALIVCLTGSPTGAADHDWTGFYLGLHAGIGLNDSSYKLTPTGAFLTGGFPATNHLRTDSADLTGAAFTGGLHGGYNWQFKEFVFGPEIDFSYNGVDQSDIVNRPLGAPAAGNFIHNVSQKVDWLGTVRARAGLSLLPQWLVYATGGLAYGHVSSDTRVLFSVGDDHYAGSHSTTRVGWTVGGGTEWAITSRWSARLEYLYVDLGQFSYRDACVNCAALGFDALSYQTDIKTREHIVRFGASYRFWGAGR